MDILQVPKNKQEKRPSATIVMHTTAHPDIEHTQQLTRNSATYSHRRRYRALLSCTTPDVNTPPEEYFVAENPIGFVDSKLLWQFDHGSGGWSPLQ